MLNSKLGGARHAVFVLVSPVLMSASSCATEDQPELSREMRAVTTAPAEASEGDTTGGSEDAIPDDACRSGGPTLAVPGAICASRGVARCEDGWPLSSLLEGIAAGCGFSPSDDALELFLDAGCVTGLAFDASSRANDQTIQSCLLRELGGVRAACQEQLTCVRLYSTTLASSLTRAGSGRCSRPGA
jgi:hypothetical protein